MSGMPQTYALTLHRPWPWAFVAAGKRIENRTWQPWCPIGTRLALHAGQEYDRAGALWMVRRFGAEIPPLLPAAEHPVGVVAVATLAEVLTFSRDPWFVGPYGWRLDEVRVLAEPVPCQGKQGLWRLPHSVLMAVERELERADRSAGALA